MSELDKITLRDMVKNLLSNLEQLEPEQQYLLNSAVIVPEFGKIPIEQPVTIYIDLDLLIDFPLGKLIKDFSQQDQMQKVLDLLNQLKDKPYYTLGNAIIDNNDDLDLICYYAPFKVPIITLKDLVNNIEPIWKSGNIYDINKYITIHINQHPYCLSDILKEYLKLIITSILGVANISFINVSYMQLDPKAYKFLFVYSLRDFLGCKHILQKIQQYNPQSFRFGLDDIFLFANRRNIITKEIFEQKYNKNLELANKELQLFGAYMNIFLTFNYIDEFPLLMDDLIKQEVIIDG